MDQRLLRLDRGGATNAGASESNFGGEFLKEPPGLLIIIPREVIPQRLQMLECRRQVPLGVGHLRGGPHPIPWRAAPVAPGRCAARA
jgi:hypothetical protein